MKHIYFALIALFSVCTSMAQTAPADSELVSRISAATVIILTGEGAGRLTAIGSGVIVRPDGVILTAHHVIKEAHEVQISCTAAMYMIKLLSLELTSGAI